MDLDKISEIVSGCEIIDNKIAVNSNIHKLIEFVRDNYSFDILQEIIGNHKKDNKIELIYHLFSTVNEEDLLISFSTEKDAESIADLFESAIADENEIYDLFGINFIGNENLKRLYMPENWEGHPLRKDYVQNDTRLCWNDNDNV